MSVGANYLREHVTSDIRIHYVYKEAGTAPNIVPDKASVWYYVRGASRKNIEDTYLYSLEIFDNGSSSIDVQALQRDRISFTGDMKFDY